MLAISQRLVKQDRERFISKQLKEPIRSERRRILIEYLGGECVKCGYDRCVSALHFHHIDPDKKLFIIGANLTTRKWQSLVNEANKCELLCANCHIEHHQSYT